MNTEKTVRKQAKKVLEGNQSVIISEIIFKTHLEWINYVGMTISLIGFCAYNYYRHHEGVRKKELDNIYELEKLEVETDDEELAHDDHRL